MSDYFMRQCTMQKPVGEGSTQETTSWIPEEFAKVGRIVKLKDGDEWTDGWKVMSVGERKKASDVHERSRDYLKQRQASDI